MEVQGTSNRIQLSANQTNMVQGHRYFSMVAEKVKLHQMHVYCVFGDSNTIYKYCILQVCVQVYIVCKQCRLLQY